jgi:HAMP domain-containing protein
MRALVVAALVLATAALMFVTVNTARATARLAMIRAGHSTIQAPPAMPDKRISKSSPLSS